MGKQHIHSFLGLVPQCTIHMLDMETLKSPDKEADLVVEDSTLLCYIFCSLDVEI